MVSFQTLLSPNHHYPPQTISEFEINNPSKKRKWDQTEPHKVDHNPKIKPWTNTAPANPKTTTSTTKSTSPIDLQFDIPSTPNWQRCPDIQSGEIRFYNTKTHKRTQRHPRVSEVTPFPAPIPQPSLHISLDLELNLPCGDHHGIPPGTKMNNKSNSSANDKIRSTFSLFSSLSPAAADRDRQEMVAAACKRCHLLVMFCKSNPACPNCKFMHPPDLSPPTLLKPRFNLLC